MPDAPPQSSEALLVLDAAIGASVLAASGARAVGRGVQRVVRPVAVVVLRPPMLTPRYQTGTWLDLLARHGVRRRDELKHQMSAVLDATVPPVAAAVLERIDLARLAEGVIAEVDLPDIIRQSTGSVASDTVRGVRLQGISGDEAVGRAVGRLRVRFGRKPSRAGVPAVEPEVSPPAGTEALPSEPGPEMRRTPYAAETP